MIKGSARGIRSGTDTLEAVLSAAATLAVRHREPWTPTNWQARVKPDDGRAELIDGLVASSQLREELRRSFQVPSAILDFGTVGFCEAALASDDPREFAAYGLIHPDGEVAAAAAVLARHADTLPVPEPRRPRQPPTLSASPQPLQEVVSHSKPAGNGNARKEQAVIVVPRAQQATVGAVTIDGQSSRAWRSRALAAERKVERLSSLLPSKRTKARQNRQKADLEHALAELEPAKKRIADLEDQVRRITVDLATAREDRNDAFTERDTAQLARRTLESRLGDVSGRAEYLRRLLPREIEVNAAAAEAATGRLRGRLRRRGEALAKLMSGLDDAFPPQAVTSSERSQLSAGPAMSITTASMDLRVLPLGGATEIGGSALLIEVGGKRILVDAGLRPQGETLVAMAPPRIEEAVQAGIDLVVITHAHSDHAGYIPALLSRLPRTQVVSTSGTAALLHTMWEDSRRVLERRLETDGARLGGAMPLYSETDIGIAVERVRPHSLQRVWRLGGIELELFSAGHILGAAGLALRAGERRVLVTGDISDRDQATVGAAHLPGPSWRNADLLVIESTYCIEDHRSRDAEVDAFVSTVEETVSRGDRVLIPAFGLGRAQEVILVLRERLPGVPIMVDGIARDISRIYEEEVHRQGRDLELLGGDVRVIENRSRNMEIRAFEEGVVVTTSGMLNGGPVVAWAAEVLPDPDAALLLCGYQDEESPGSRLQAMAEGRSERVICLGEGDEQISVNVRARVETYHLSAHADRGGLIRIIDELAPAATMLVHGYPRQQRRFRDGLGVHGANTVPTGDWIAS